MVNWPAGISTILGSIGGALGAGVGESAPAATDHKYRLAIVNFDKAGNEGEEGGNTRQIPKREGLIKVIAQF